MHFNCTQALFRFLALSVSESRSIECSGGTRAFENKILDFLLSELERLVDIASSPDTGEQSEHLSLPQMEELLQLLLRCCQNSSQVALRLSQKESLSLLLRLMGNRRSSSIIVLTLRITRHVFPKLKCRVLAQVTHMQC